MESDSACHLCEWKAENGFSFVECYVHFSSFFRAFWMSNVSTPVIYVDLLTLQNITS